MFGANWKRRPDGTRKGGRSAGPHVLGVACCLLLVRGGWEMGDCGKREVREARNLTLILEISQSQNQAIDNLPTIDYRHHGNRRRRERRSTPPPAATTPARGRRTRAQSSRSERATTAVGGGQLRRRPRRQKQKQERRQRR